LALKECVYHGLKSQYQMLMVYNIGIDFIHVAITFVHVKDITDVEHVYDIYNING